MAFQWTADNVTEVAIRGHWTNGRPVVNVLHVRREEDDPAESARDVLNNWQDHVLNLLSGNYSLDGARFTDKESVDGVTGFVIPDPAKFLVGQQPVVTLPPNNAVLIHKEIASSVGRHAGRIYLPAERESVYDDNGLVGATALANYNTRMGTFFDGVSGALDNELVVVHKRDAIAGHSSVSVVSGLRCDPKIATQRRRLRG